MALSFEGLAPYLGALGTSLEGIDENTTGGDDFAGAILLYAAEVISAIVANEDIPEFPDVLRQGTSDKITGIGRVILISANALLTVAQFQVAGKAQKVLKYVNQAIRQLLAGQPVTPAPTGL